MEYPTIVYRGFGPHSRKGGGFSTLGVEDDVALDAALSDGWFATLPEAIADHDKLPPVSAPVSAPVVAPVIDEPAVLEADPVVEQTDPVPGPSIPDDVLPPTREEIEAKCAELGIRVHHRHTNETLMGLIDEALAMKG